MPHLPFGFDPDGGTFSNVKLPPPRVNNRYAGYAGTATADTSYTPAPDLNWWQRFDRCISNIGNWFSDNFDDAVDKVCIWLFFIIILGAVGAVIATWVSSGFLNAVFVGIGALIVIGIGYYIGEIVLSILTGVLMFAGRFIFWNGITFLLFLSALIGGWAHSAIASDKEKKPATTVVAANTHEETYTCTAAVLNVRAEPNTTSAIRGTLTRGQKVKVQKIDNGFASIDYNGRTCYVAARYLQAEKQSVSTQ